MERPKGRITLRMEPSHVERMDAFLNETDDFDSRSQLCRAALDNYINILERKSDEVLVRIPEAFLEMIDKFVESKYFVSRDEAINVAVRKYFTDEVVSAIIKDLETVGRATGKVPTIRYEDREQIIPR